MYYNLAVVTLQSLTLPYLDSEDKSRDQTNSDTNMKFTIHKGMSTIDLWPYFPSLNLSVICPLVYSQYKLSIFKYQLYQLFLTCLPSYTCITLQKLLKRCAVI